ncbi:hypothetical protein QCE73_19085 [Caballeronia sp. LZ029]|uniref:hypothetical protein n=1 Tax=Caballeronia sp. LZ029 TaxID=3038564 RepID=UPI00285ED4D5|nr:hypothetical protein [Caballeronia sp. LZ029]MDR5745266.1 hypothetical protein [Caballeronia sp. LZ029]
MSIVPSRHAVVACFAVCVSAIVCGCGKQETASEPSATPATSITNATNATNATSELQDWAKQATAGASDPAERAVVARSASEPLATPVIHTVD